MSDDADQAQAREESARAGAIERARRLAHLPDRICVRCGESLPRTIREAHPDWTDCNGLCAYR